MNTKTITTASPRVIARLVAALAAAVAVTLAVGAPSQAYQIASRSNVPVMPTIYQVQGAHYDSGSAVTGPMWRQWVYQPGASVQRTASGSQSVQVTYTTQRYSSTGWSTISTNRGSVTIPSTQVSASLPALSILPTQGSGYYRVLSSIVWTSAIGAVQSSLSVNMTDSGDYRCVTSRPCTAGAGWVYLG